MSCPEERLSCGMRKQEDLGLRTFQRLMVRQKKTKLLRRLRRVIRQIRRKPGENNVFDNLHLSSHPAPCFSMPWEAHFYYPGSPAPSLMLCLANRRKESEYISLVPSLLCCVFTVASFF